jgi:hypothetical protein
MGMSDQPNSNTNSNDKYAASVLRQQRQRLFMLRHVSKCPFPTNCPVTPDCETMKTLWFHLLSCRDINCQTERCSSSRHVLTHYSRCQDSECPICDPLRKMISHKNCLCCQGKRHISSSRSQPSILGSTNIVADSDGNFRPIVNSSRKYEEEDLVLGMNMDIEIDINMDLSTVYDI